MGGKVRHDLDWLHENPGVWRCIAKRRYPPVVKHFRGDNFERKYIRDLMTDEWELWVRFRNLAPVAIS